MMEVHRQFRFWLLLLTMAFLALTYASRLLWHQEVTDFLSVPTVAYWKTALYLMGTSGQSPIGIAPYLIFIILTVVEIKCCGLVAKNIHRFIQPIVVD